MSSQHSPRLLVAFKGAYFYGEGGRGEKEKREGSGWKRRGKPPNILPRHSWLVRYRDGIPARKRTAISVLTGPDVR